jgi:predicted metalloprotease
MRLDDQRESTNIEDRRGDSGGLGGLGGGGGGGLRLGGGRMGLGGLLVVVVIALIFGINPLSLLGGGGGPQEQIGQPQSQIAPATTAAGDPSGKFVRQVLGSTEDTWGQIFPQQVGKAYTPPTLVMFSGSVSSACGRATSASGPFYCPADRKVYLDTSFFNELSQRFGAPGDFAQAYVIAHEIGHHVQTLLGISDQVRRAQERASEKDANALSVRMELQADCLAGVWGKANIARLEPGDVEEALTAATAIGDDRLQRQSRGMVVPDSFTHGTSEQRVRWFKIGMANGAIADCDTFSARAL